MRHDPSETTKNPLEALTPIRGLAPSPRANDYLTRIAVRGLRHEQETLEVLISATPTGDRRNKLCDANIHLGRTVALLEGLL